MSLRKFLGSALPLFFAAIATCGPAIAQTQTVESAQKFLAAAVKGQVFQFGWYEPTPEILFTGPVKSFDAESACKQRMKADMGARHVSGGTHEAEQFNALFFFSKLAQVTHRDQTHIDLYFMGDSRPRTLIISSDEMATRVAYALAFLKDKCDSTRDTGF